MSVPLGVKTVGMRMVYGVPESIREIRGVPVGANVHLRLRFRQRDFAQVFVRTPREISRHAISVDSDGAWRIGPITGLNKRVGGL